MKSHRGISTVVGTVFLIAVVISALSYVTYSLDVMGNFSESLIVEERRQKDRQSEAFEISSIDVTAANKLDGVVKNTGEIPVKLTTLWIDEQGVNDAVQKFTLDKEIAPGNTVNLNSLVDFTMNSSKGYNMKIVSSRGDVNSFYVNSLSTENIYMTLQAYPTIIPSTFSSTLVFTVVNNMSNGNYLYNLTPIMNSSGAFEIFGGSEDISVSKLNGPSPISYPTLGPGEVAVFTYEYEISGDMDDYNQFNVTLANANIGNNALTSVFLKEVPIATSSGSALTSFGLEDANAADADILYFHSFNGLTPVGVYPMDAASPGSPGLTKSPNGNSLEFISANTTALTTTLPVGEFTVALNYFTSPVPLGFPTPTFAYFFECDDCDKNDNTYESIGVIDKGDSKLASQQDDPLWKSPTSSPPYVDGPDGDGYFEFVDDKDWFNGEWDLDKGSASGIGDAPDVDALWVRIPSGFNDGYAPIIRYGDKDNKDNNDEYYEVSVVGTGKIEFKYATSNPKDKDGDPDEITCTTDGEFDVDAWIHIVAVRESSHACTLYVNGAFEKSFENTSLNDDKDETVDTGKDGGVYVGAIDEKIVSKFDGDVATWMHWDSGFIPTTDEITELYYTNYGQNATRLYMTVERTDGTGVPIEDIISKTSVELPFHDPAVNSAASKVNLASGNDTEVKYSQGNMTLSSIANFTFGLEERIKVTLDWNDEDNQNLPINILFDQDSGFWSLPDGPSYLQTPPPDPSWPSYLSFHYQHENALTVFNDGPDGIWFTYSGTRMLLTSIDGLTSYGGLAQSVNASQAISPEDNHIDSDQDSIYIPDQNYAELLFYPLSSPASISSSCQACRVCNGDYNTFIYLSGYDEKGETFLKTVNLGIANIYGNPSC